jgi:hypothetical protein
MEQPWMEKMKSLCHEITPQTITQSQLPGSESGAS